MLVKFEQNRMIQNIQNFELFDQKWLFNFDKVLTPFWKTFRDSNNSLIVIVFIYYLLLFILLYLPRDA